MGTLLYNNSKQETILKEEISENILAIYLEEEQVNYIPNKNSGYILDIEKSSCTNGATLSFDYNTWTIQTNFSNYTNTDNSRVKCSLYFRKILSAIDYIKILGTVTKGNGIYKAVHDNATITYTINTSIINNLKQTELRYGGANPNNYIWFNEELWRIIGVVNTPEGQRIKISKFESIGLYSWDTSLSTINNGAGINEWSQADLMKLLNPGYESETIGGSLYYNSNSGSCYSGAYDKVVSCDFTNNGLKKEVLDYIDTITWNLGTNGLNSWNKANIYEFYDYERGANTGKNCISGLNCTDTITRTYFWKGKIGLISPSDYGYATSGGINTTREKCLNTALYNWNNTEISDCYTNNWLHQNYANWSILPVRYNNQYATTIYAFFYDGTISYPSAYNIYEVHPTLYLTEDIKIISGNGTIDSPYLIEK